MDRRGLRQRHRLLQGLRPGPQARAVQAEAPHRYHHRLVQEPRRGGLRARQAVDEENQGALGAT